MEWEELTYGIHFEEEKDIGRGTLPLGSYTWAKGSKLKG